MLSQAANTRLAEPLKATVLPYQVYTRSHIRIPLLHLFND